MRARHTLAAVVSVAIVLTFVLVPIGPATASHGTSGADCPTGIEIGMAVVAPDGQITFVSEGESAPPITYLDKILVVGELSADQTTDPAADVSGEPVQVKATELGTAVVRTYDATTGSDDEAGLFAPDPPPTPYASARWTAHWAGTGTCDGLTEDSGYILLGVRVRMTISRSHLRPPAGFTFTIRGGVSPNHAGRFVTMQWKAVGSSTINSATATLDSLSHYSKQFVSNSPGSQWDFRAIFPKQDADHQANVTPWVRVSIT